MNSPKITNGVADNGAGKIVQTTKSDATGKMKP